MAEETGQEKTEAPTQRRREEARQQGRVTVSAELTSGVVLLAGLLALYLGSNPLAEGLVNYLRLAVDGSCQLELGIEQLHLLWQDVYLFLVQLLSVFMVTLIAASLAVGFLQAGFHVTTELVGVRWERLSPAENLNRLFSIASLGKAVISLVKIVVVAALAWWFLRGRIGQVTAVGEMPLTAAAAHGWDLLLRLALLIAATLFVFGVIDYAFQRYRFELSLRMTRQELKEELKREEGDPLLKARIRRLQREVAQRRMLAEVPKATVVITNPTHLAIALRYDRATMPAPKVVAKGGGMVAARIVELAHRHGVPLVERKPLARLLYRWVGIDQTIPPTLYLVVAEVLAYLYRIRGISGLRLG